MPLVRAEELTYDRIRQLDRHRSIAFLAVSGLEVHGPHLPIVQDVAMAQWMAEETARRFSERHPDWTVAVYPPLTVGTDELPLRGSMDVRPSAFHRVLLGHGASLARAGFGTVVVTNGHGGPRHAAAIEHACRRTSRRFGIRMITPSIRVLHRVVTGGRNARLEELLGRPLDAREREALVTGEHAGAWETSFMLATRPELVDPCWRSLGPLAPPRFRPLAALGEFLPPLRETTDQLAGSVGWLLNAHFGYGGTEVSWKGDPSVASPEIGHAFKEILAEDCTEIVLDVVRGALAPENVRSIASDHAVIQPGFFARLAIAAAALLALLS